MRRFMHRRRRRYLFRSKEQSVPGLISFSLGMISVVSLILVIYSTYARGGRAPVQYGAVTLLCLVFSLCGLIVGILARREPDKIYFFAGIGIILNLAVILFCFVVMYLGLM